jgi:WD40 repeat protein
VTALAPIGETQLLSAGRDHHLRLWDVAARRLVAERSLGDYTWVRSLASSPDATRVLLHQGRVEMCALPTLEDLHMYMSRGKVRRIIFGLDAQHAIVGHSDGSVQPYAIEWRNVRPYWPRNAPRKNRPNLVHKDGALTRHADRIVDLALLAEPAVVVSAASDGAVHFSSIEEHGLVGAVQAPSGQITSLHISPDQQVMALGSANASLSLWDIRALGIKGLLLRPFAETTVALMPVFDLLRDDEALEPAARRALDYAERVMRHRFRHDVEVGEAPLIMMGEFDIEID